MNEQLLRAELQKCNSVAEMFNVINKFYDIESTRPGAIVKATLIGGLLNGLKITQAKPRK